MAGANFAARGTLLKLGGRVGAFSWLLWRRRALILKKRFVKEKESSLQRTLHAATNTKKGADRELFYAKGDAETLLMQMSSATRPKRRSVDSLSESAVLNAPISAEKLLSDTDSVAITSQDVEKSM